MATTQRMSRTPTATTRRKTAEKQARGSMKKFIDGVIRQIQTVPRAGRNGDLR